MIPNPAICCCCCSCSLCCCVEPPSFACCASRYALTACRILCALGAPPLLPFTPSTPGADPFLVGIEGCNFRLGLAAAAAAAPLMSGLLLPVALLPFVVVFALPRRSGMLPLELERVTVFIIGRGPRAYAPSEEEGLSPLPLPVPVPVPKTGAPSLFGTLLRAGLLPVLLLGGGFLVRDEPP